ncbi:MAG: DUF2057 domain-containing protein [Candidatus Thiodiazotropha sp. (ex Dulcina madagascariensis)]|nr:DUF2057 domain-containing protein [Candidatus Thiodiazotropha sp. (ex Dulcina madagascariensis)]
MKMNKTILLLLLSLLTAPLSAARLVMPDIFEILAVDGKQTERTFLTHADTIQLSEGMHKIALRYVDVVMDPDLGYEAVLNSQPFIITIKVEAGATYRLEAEKKAFEDKQAYAKHPVVAIRDEADNGQWVTLEIDRPEKQSDKWARETVIASKPVDQLSTTTQMATAEAQQRKATVSAADKLKYWWSQADKRTRQEFINWIVGNQN